MTRNQQGLNRFEGRLIDDRGNLAFDNFGLGLSFAVTLPRKLIEVSNAGVCAPREHFMNGTSPKQWAIPRAIAACVEPFRDLLRSQRTAGAITVFGKVEGPDDGFCFDRLDGEFLLRLVADHLGIDGFVGKGNDASVGVAKLGVGLHRPHRGPGRFLRLVFVDDADELPEHVAGVVVRQRFGVRDQFDLVLAQGLNRELLLDLVSEGRPGERVDHDGVDFATGRFRSASRWNLLGTAELRSPGRAFSEATRSLSVGSAPSAGLDGIRSIRPHHC